MMELVLSLNLAHIIGVVIVTLVSILLSLITWIAKKSYNKIESIEKLLTRAIAKNIETSERVAALDQRVTRVESVLDSILER